MQIDAELLRALRLAAGRTQQEQAERCDITYTYYIKLESGARSNPSLPIVRQLCLGAGCFLRDLVTDPITADLALSDVVRARQILAEGEPVERDARKRLKRLAEAQEMRDAWKAESAKRVEETRELRRQFAEGVA